MIYTFSIPVTFDFKLLPWLLLSSAMFGHVPLN